MSIENPPVLPDWRRAEDLNRAIGYLNALMDTADWNTLPEQRVRILESVVRMIEPYSHFEA